MSKLQLIIENSLDENDDGKVKTCSKTFCLEVENDNGEFCYQSIKVEFCYQRIKLAKYELSIKWAKTVYPSAISNICTKVEQILSSFVVSVAFSNILLLLDTKSWPKDDFVSFGNCKINKLTEHYMALLNKNGCDVSKISSEWTHSMTYIFPMLHNSPNKSYFKIWHWIFTNNEVMVECQSIMHIFEILMTVPFMNAIVEHLLSQMNRFKADFCNRLSRSLIRVCMSEKKGVASKISSLITLLIIGQQRRKDVSSHIHIIIL